MQYLGKPKVTLSASRQSARELARIRTPFHTGRDTVDMKQDNRSSSESSRGSYSASGRTAVYSQIRRLACYRLQVFATVLLMGAAFAARRYLRRYSNRDHQLADIATSRSRLGQSGMNQRPITKILNLGYNIVLAVALPRAPVMRLSRRGQFWLALFSTAFLGGWPVLLNTGLILIQPSLALTTPSAIGWIVAYAALDFAMLAAAWWNWHLLVKYAAPDIDELLAESPDRANMVEAWLRAHLRMLPQSIVSVSTAGIVILLFQAVSAKLERLIQIAPMSYVVIGWTALIGGNCLYWLYTIGFLPLRIYKCRHPKLVWHDPSTTPAVVTGCDGFGFTALALGFGIVVTEVIGFLILRKTDSLLLQILSIVFPIFGLITVFFAAALPYMVMISMVRQSRRQTLRWLSDRIEDLPATNESAESRTYIELYHQVSSTPILPINTSTIVQYITVLLGVFLTYLLQKFFA